ncbi:polyunsaturated fatty acid 5-lipoxygenase [Octopus bimaculoides]|uniref:Uncharacterized protein n=1 Tax=Octopus bimaculoides TaxID=37653 RepID=A0A0L8I1P3_OCTBM|nr:polyunsaturated fatty acid 5-lipoxygenase [Octopus bimaculoides]XP_052831117.1 polyunsaturated fatty acid 5-lipoxygenase [Octopus bimaculoides]XP_052831118.1 polyunsaturated fatty acid 5-lipoxygenase [Octopus bimaculoides]
MGVKQSRFNNILEVQTGNQRGSSTDSDVFVILYDTLENATEKILLDNTCKDDFKTGARDTFYINLPVSFTEVRKIELWTKPCVIELTSSDWFVDVIKFGYRFGGNTITFPVFRWIKPEVHYYLYPWDAFLPQYDPDKSQRASEIECKCTIYNLNYKENFPVTCKDLPREEEFPSKYMRSMLTKKLDIVLTNMCTRIVAGKWHTLKDLMNIYRREKLPMPKSVKFWREDTWFGYQRLNGCNPTVIKLCEEIPSKLAVDDDLMKPVLKEETLEDLIKKKRLFYTDLNILEDIRHRKYLHMCAPIGLFMLNSEDDLVPIAIQLQQQKGPDNPVRIF